MPVRRVLAAPLTAVLAVVGLLLGLGAVSGDASAATARTATAPTLAWRAQAPAALVIGRSVSGRYIVARRQGPATAPKVLLVVGQMHGSEPAGRAVVGQVRTLAPPKGVQVWTISTMNPDGSVRRTRQNARGVDLNRNFPQGWLRTYTSRIYYPGPVPLSEPESQAMVRFLNNLRPDLVVSLHQAARSIDVGNPKTRLWAYRLAQAFHLPTRTVSCYGPCAGTMTGWFNTYYSGFAVTVELPRTVTAYMARYYARAALKVGAMLVPAPTPAPTPSTTSPSPTATSATPTPSDTVTAAPAPAPAADTPTPSETVGPSAAP
ncbi:MAG: M14 family zinc carboxypeptidase [Candidatus Nanopelagicales bacterium]